jgi:hypothetical protein
MKVENESDIRSFAEGGGRFGRNYDQAYKCDKGLDAGIRLSYQSR